MARKVSRGLSELLANVEDVGEVKTGEKDILTVPVEEVYPGADQPRKDFDEQSLKELAQSIKLHGVITPLIVTKTGKGYEIIAGERRFRAAKMAGVAELPIVCREYGEREKREISIIENLQREDLNAIEEAEAIRELMANYGLTQDEAAERLGKSRSGVANTLRLLRLPDSLKKAVKSGLLSAGHGRALLPLEDAAMQISLARKAIKEGWSVRQLERQVRYCLKPETRPTKLTDVVREKLSADMRKFVDDMTEVFATKVRLMGNETKGRIAIDYYTNDDLQRIYDLVESLKNR